MTKNDSSVERGYVTPSMPSPQGPKPNSGVAPPPMPQRPVAPPPPKTSGKG